MSIVNVHANWYPVDGVVKHVDPVSYTHLDVYKRQMMFIALTIVSCLRMVGIVLAISLLTLPQMTANLFTHSFKKIIWWRCV